MRLRTVWEAAFRWIVRKRILLWLRIFFPALTPGAYWFMCHPRQGAICKLCLRAEWLFSPDSAAEPSYRGTEGRA